MVLRMFWAAVFSFFFFGTTAEAVVFSTKQKQTVQRAPQFTLVPTHAGPIVTDLYLNTGCEINDARMRVVARHGDPALCENVSAYAMVNDDGDFYQIGKHIGWTIADPDLVSLECHGADESFCTVRTWQDMTTNGGEEPASLLTACVRNWCGQQQDCEPKVCRSVEIVSVFNLEGEWTLTGPALEPETRVGFVQTGREFEDVFQDIDRGYVIDDEVEFEVYDQGYFGFIAADGQSMSGIAYDLMSGDVSGEWFATRP